MTKYQRNSLQYLIILICFVGSTYFFYDKYQNAVDSHCNYILGEYHRAYTTHFSGKPWKIYESPMHVVNEFPIWFSPKDKLNEVRQRTFIPAYAIIDKKYDDRFILLRIKYILFFSLTQILAFFFSKFFVGVFTVKN